MPDEPDKPATAAATSSLYAGILAPSQSEQPVAAQRKAPELTHQSSTEADPASASASAAPAPKSWSAALRFAPRAAARPKSRFAPLTAQLPSSTTSVRPTSGFVPAPSTLSGTSSTSSQSATTTPVDNPKAIQTTIHSVVSRPRYDPPPLYLPEDEVRADRDEAQHQSYLWRALEPSPFSTVPGIRDDPDDPEDVNGFLSRSNAKVSRRRKRRRFGEATRLPMQVDYDPKVPNDYQAYVELRQERQRLSESGVHEERGSGKVDAAGDGYMDNRPSWLARSPNGSGSERPRFVSGSGPPPPGPPPGPPPLPPGPPPGPPPSLPPGPPPGPPPGLNYPN